MIPFNDKTQFYNDGQGWAVIRGGSVSVSFPTIEEVIAYTMGGLRVSGKDQEFNELCQKRETIIAQAGQGEMRRAA